MKCCGKDLGQGKPFVLIQYWCDTCKTEHLVDAKEMTDYIAKLHTEKQANGALPDIL